MPSAYPGWASRRCAGRNATDTDPIHHNTPDYAIRLMSADASMADRRAELGAPSHQNADGSTRHGNGPEGRWED